MNKYKNKKTELDGIVFDSKKEAYHYSHLKLLQEDGIINDLQMQVKFLIVPKSGNNTKARYYVADFVYVLNNGTKVIDDVKSPITKKNPVYSLKKSLVLYLYPEYKFVES